jgi:DNA-binding response OmpR family regulator
VEFGLLGPVEVSDDAAIPVHVGKRIERTLLELLLLEPNRRISIDEILGRLWRDTPPAVATFWRMRARSLRSSAGGRTSLIEACSPKYEELTSMAEGRGSVQRR